MVGVRWLGRRRSRGKGPWGEIGEIGGQIAGGLVGGIA